MVAVCIIHSDERYWLQMTQANDGAYYLARFGNARLQAQKVELQYRKHLTLGGSLSTSAMIHSLYFQYSFNDFESEAAALAWVESAAIELKTHELRHISGWAAGMPLKPENAALMWERGVKPRLISEAREGYGTSC